MEAVEGMRVWGKTHHEKLSNIYYMADPFTFVGVFLICN